MPPKFMKIWGNEDLKAEYKTWHEAKFGTQRGNKKDAAEYFGVTRQFIGQVLNENYIDNIPNKKMRNEIKFKEALKGGCWMPFDDDNNEG